MPDFMMNARLDPEGHGFYPDEDDIISIGSAIPTYWVTEEGQIEESDWINYPIFLNDKIVAIGSTYNKNGKSTISYGNLFADELNEYLENEPNTYNNGNSATFGEIGLVFDSNSLSVYNYVGSVSTIVEYEGEDYSLGQIESVDSTVFSYLDLGLNEITEIMDISDAIFSNPYSSYFYKMLGTGTITQYSNTCWAANVALIGRWHTGKVLSATDVADYMGKTYSEGGNIYEAQIALNDIYGVYYSIFDEPLDKWTLMYALENDTPIYANCFGDGDGLGHTVTVNGYDEEEDRLRYMDSNKRTYVYTDFFDGSAFILNNGKGYVNTQYMC